LYSRYGDHYYINSRLSYCYLTDELNFWKTVNIKLSSSFETNTSSNTLKTFLLHQFNKYSIENIIEKLESCLKT